jgi:hypothetical protein
MEIGHRIEAEIEPNRYIMPEKVEIGAIRADDQ